MGLTKVQLQKRDKDIVKMLVLTTNEGHFKFTFEEIATVHTITRERVRQIGNTAGLPTRTKALDDRRKVFHNNAPECSIEHCKNRVKVSSKSSWSYLARCADHGRDVVLITCSYCGKESERERYAAYTDHRIKTNRLRTKPQRHWFCDKTCMGRFIGNEYGFVAHPENMYYEKKKGRTTSLTLKDLKDLAETL